MMTENDFLKQIKSIGVGDVINVIEVVDGKEYTNTSFSKSIIFGAEVIVMMDEYNEVHVIQDTHICGADELIYDVYDNLVDDGIDFYLRRADNQDKKEYCFLYGENACCSYDDGIDELIKRVDADVWDAKSYMFTEDELRAYKAALEDSNGWEMYTTMGNKDYHRLMVATGNEQG